MYENIDKTKYTPMMQQYLTIKEDYRDSIVFFRLGDFYEMFFSDALLASRELEIALTARDAGAEDKVPMCGVPHHSSQSYIEKLIEKGYKVAICDQVEDASVAKGLVKRDVVRLITPGTIMESGSLNESTNNFIAAISKTDEYQIVYTDLSTGECFATSIPLQNQILMNELLSIGAKEIIIDSDFQIDGLENFINSYDIVVSHMDDTELMSYLNNHVDEFYRKTFARLTNYILSTQKRKLMHIQEVEVYTASSCLKIDAFSMKNLELTETIRSGSRKGSLLWYLDKCQTAMGSRYLRKSIEKPLVSNIDIEKRYDLVDDFKNNFFIKEEIKEYLRSVYDLERIVGRISYGNANARDFVQLRTSLGNLPSMKLTLSKLTSNIAIELAEKIELHSDLFNLLQNSLVDNPPIGIKDGAMIKQGYNTELDEIKNASTSGKEWLLELEKRERERTGIKKLKVGYNRVFGYYIEITKGQLNLINEDFGYERKQTLSNSERYISPELKEKEALILGSEEKSIKLEYELFTEIREKSKEYIGSLQKLARVISELDLLQSFSTVAEENRLIRPILTDQKEVNIIDGRHPVVEKVLNNEKYVENDCYMSEETTVLLITGPNMSGKSTYMRQLATIVIMAQIGSFVPAKSAILPIFDKIFTRIGAADDLVSGQSTFMVEMLEVNYALQNATERSLILFDEIGRGTATYDGMALAQGIIEYIHEYTKCKSLFSTHYHELTQLENHLGTLKNIHVSAKEEKGEIVFFHKIKKGAVDKSYGINVAKLARLPKVLINRSSQILKELEKNRKDDLNLFNFEDVEVVEDPIIDEIRNINVNELSPIEALNTLYTIVEKVK
ncbi:DNA mismatch repair protein MutS [Mycoplasmatota bacterium]|nr:DNA mismatch repair protein MutS [Mycoplasmatota bacterium]